MAKINTTMQINNDNNKSNNDNNKKNHNNNNNNKNNNDNDNDNVNNIYYNNKNKNNKNNNNNNDDNNSPGLGIASDGALGLKLKVDFILFLESDDVGSLEFLDQILALDDGLLHHGQLSNDFLYGHKEKEGRRRGKRRGRRRRRGKSRGRR